MTQEMSSQRRSKMEMGLDKLSDLPSNVMEKILLLLPIKEAARTSVLATNWRKRWAKLPQLAFDGQCVSSQSNTSFVTIVDHALLVHLGPLRSFKLSYNGNLASRDVDRWIVHLSRHSIEEFDLEYHEGDQYKIPACFFSWQDIIDLWLTNCLLQPLPTFKGFKSLKKLHIVRVTLAQNVLVNLVRCSLLMELLMVDCKGFTDLEIDAPKLQFLLFQGGFDDVILRNTTNLSVVSISQESYADVRPITGRRSRTNLIMKMLLFSFEHTSVRELAIRGKFLQYLSPSVSESKPLLHLKLLTIEVHFNNPREISTVLRFLKSSPALQELDIVACTKDQAFVGEVNSRLDNNPIRSLPDLQIVKISNISGAKAELDFIRFLLLSTPMLRKMIIQPASVSDSSELLKKLIRLSRASVHSEIIYLDP